MTRALIASVLLAAAAIAALGVDPMIALGYSFAACILVWFLSPLLRLIWRRIARRRRNRSHPLAVPAPTTHLTQINHHHYYGQGPEPLVEPAPWPQEHHLALPRRTEQQLAHDRIYNVIDPDGKPQ